MVSINLTERAAQCLAGAISADHALNKAIYYAHKALQAVHANPRLEITSDYSRSNGGYGTTVIHPSTGLPIVPPASESDLTVGPERFNVARETRMAVAWFCEHYSVSQLSAYSALICFGTYAESILEKDSNGKIESCIPVSERFALPDDFDTQLNRHHVPEQAVSA